MVGEQLKFRLQNLAICFRAAFLIASTVESRAFSLLGPVQPWMQSSNGVINSGDIGGPMCISNEYRWNVPALTYGFDQSFSNYFGTNGIAAVESAIQILNDLPPASQIALTNYPFSSQHINFAAQSQNLNDLKSETLSLLLEHLGLAQPKRYMFVIQQWNPILTNGNLYTSNSIPNYVVQRNYDPQTLNVSSYLNGALYAFATSYDGRSTFINPYLVAPIIATPLTPVADFSLNAGFFYAGLTYDDVGGLAYLLSTNNINYETLLTNIVGVGTNVNSFVNGAWRPGVDKITFVPQPMDSLTSTFLPVTNQFTDTYITNGIVMRQQLARVTTQPDFLFSVADTGEGNFSTPWFVRTGTTNWINNAAANGNTNGSGPGVIQAPVQITFNKMGERYGTVGSISDIGASGFPQSWGTFDNSGNIPVVYPIPQTGTNQMTVRMWLERGTNPYQSTTSFEWKPTSIAGAQFTLQSSTDLVAWTNLFTVTNSGIVWNYFNYNPASSSRFYRLIPQ